MPLKRSTSLAMPFGHGGTGENGKQGVSNVSITSCSAEQWAATLAMVSNMPRAHYARRHRNSEGEERRKSKSSEQRSRSSSDNSGSSSEGARSHVKRSVPHAIKKKQQYEEPDYWEDAAVPTTTDKQKAKNKHKYEDAPVSITADKQKEKEEYYWEEDWEDTAVYITADKKKTKKQHDWEDTTASITADKHKQKEQTNWEEEAVPIITADKKKEKIQHYWEDDWEDTAVITADKQKAKEQQYWEEDWEDTAVYVTADKKKTKKQHNWEDTAGQIAASRQHKQRQDQYAGEDAPLPSSRQHKQHKEQQHRNGNATATTTTTTTSTASTTSASSRNPTSFKASSREVHVKALGELQTAAARLPHPEVVYGAMIPEPDYSDDERETAATKQATLVSRNNQVNASSPVPKEGGANTGRLDEKGLIMPKKLVNPCLESSEKKNLHKELLYNQKRGVSVLNQKSELQKAMEKHNDKKVLKEIQKEKEAALTPFQKALDERAQKLEQMEKAENKDPENDKAACEFQKIHAKVRAKMEVQ